MYEKSKLKEASYFYSRMVSETDNRDYFLYNLSAFLSAARSVLQYAIKEAQTKFGGQKWYSNHITSSKVLAFFKDKRNINVHVCKKSRCFDSSGPEFLIHFTKT